MKVYCVFDGFYSDRYLFGVFATLEAAQAGFRHSGHQPMWEEVERDSEEQERGWSCLGAVPRSMFGCGAWIDERELEGSVA